MRGIHGAVAIVRRRDNEEEIALFIASGRIAIVDFVEAGATEAADLRAYLRRQGGLLRP